MLQEAMGSTIVTGPEQLLLEMFAIFVSAKAVGEIFERLSLPSVLGEILAGAVLGPYALGWIPTSDTIHSVADLGAIFVLFSAGLETSPGELIRIGGKSMRVAVAGVVVPFLLGFAYMKLTGTKNSEAVFVGAAMVATSVGITARIFADMHLLATETAKIILGAAVFDDILGMVMLALVGGLAAGSVTVKTAPRPGPLLSASTTPPCSSTRWRTMARPRPRPPWTRVLLASAWRKSSNT